MASDDPSALATSAALPANLVTAVTPSDATDLTGIANKGIYVATAGTLVLKGTANTGAAVTLLNVQDCSFVPGDWARVMAASTATGLVAFARV